MQAILRAIADFSGQAIADFSGQAIADFSGQAIADFSGQAIADFSGQAIATSPKPIKEMMITTRLAPIPEAHSTELNSVTSLRLVYQEAKVDYFILERMARLLSANP